MVTLNAVYYLDSPDIPVGHIAIRPTLSKEKALWEDTSRGVVVYLAKSTFDAQEYQAKKVSPKKIELTSIDNQKFTLEMMTLELYNEKVRDGAVGKPNFKSTEELQAYYLQTDFI